MKHPLAIDLCEFIDGLPTNTERMILSHIATCEPCRRGVINIIQSATGYPDLFANPDDTRYWSEAAL